MTENGGNLSINKEFKVTGLTYFHTTKIIDDNN